MSEKRFPHLIPPEQKAQPESIEIGAETRLDFIPEGSPLIFKVPGKEGTYCIWSTGKNLTINKIFKAADGQWEGEWVVIPANVEPAEPDIVVEIVDDYKQAETPEKK